MYKNNFWMMLYGSGSPKRTTVWSNRKLLVLALVRALHGCTEQCAPRTKAP